MDDDASAARHPILLPTGQGKSVVQVKEVSAPQAGTSPVAVRFTATTGPMAGVEINMVPTGVGDVVAAITVVGTADDVDGATQAAVDKATSTLKTGKTGATSEKQLFDCILITKENLADYIAPFTLKQ